MKRIPTHTVALLLLHDNAVGNSVPPFAAEVCVPEVGVEIGDGQDNPLVVFLFVGVTIQSPLKVTIILLFFRDFMQNIDL